MTNQSLSTIQPDFEGILEQLQAYVNNKESWLSLQNSATAEILLESIAMVGEYDQYAIQAAVNETTFDNAHLPESIYTNSRFLGVRISRKVPAHCLVRLENSDLLNTFLEVPKFTQFNINGEKYFNREKFIFNTSSKSQDLELYQGEVKSASFIASGSAYQTYELEEKDPWSISDQDIICNVDDVEFFRSLEAVFKFSISDTKFYENSLPNGNVECKFGNGVYGVIPQANSEVVFTYAVTKGSEGNNSSSELEVKCPSFPNLVGETLTNSYDGSDEEDVEYYKQLGPESGASNGRGITREDFKSLVVKFPQVLDCNVYGQAEIAPNDKKWMNVIGLMLLTEDTFNLQSFKALIKYLKANSIFGFQFKWFQPEPVNVDLDIRIFVKSRSDLTQCRQLVISAIEEYTKLKLGSLGRSLYGSDIEDLILKTIPNDIDYIDRTHPLKNYEINKNQYIKITSINLEADYSERDSQTWVNPLDPYNFQN